MQQAVIGKKAIAAVGKIKRQIRKGKRRGCPVAVLFLRQCLRRQRICGNIISGIPKRSNSPFSDRFHPQG